MTYDLAKVNLTLTAVKDTVVQFYKTNLTIKLVEGDIVNLVAQDAGEVYYYLSKFDDGVLTVEQA